LTRRDEYEYCARLGMTQAECARHLGISAAAVSKAAKRYRIAFGNGMALSQGRRLEMVYNRYPWAAMDIGDWCEVNDYAGKVARRATVSHFPRRFRSITRDGLNIVMRAA
jgi:hypothetical protein